MRFYQGQLDFFCAAYAILNAMGGLYGLSVSQARALFADIMDRVGVHSWLLSATWRNDTDFYWLVEYMLAEFRRHPAFPLHVQRPFGPFPPETTLDEIRLRRLPSATQPKPEQFWNTVRDWLPGRNPNMSETAATRSCVLRFHRYWSFAQKPLVSHWTCGEWQSGDALFLRDASKEEGALHSLPISQVALAESGVSEHCFILLEPESLFLIERGK